MQSVGISNFFHNTKQDIPGYSVAKEPKLLQRIQHQIDQGHGVVAGYRDGVIKVALAVDPSYPLYSRVVPLTSESRLVTFYEPRQPGETPRLKIRAIVPTLPLATSIYAVLYRWDVLEEDHDRSGDSYWELVTLLCQVDAEEPMAPSTLMANHFKDDGGTATLMDAVTFEASLRESHHYWKHRCLGMTSDEYTAKLQAKPPMIIKC